MTRVNIEGTLDPELALLLGCFTQLYYENHTPRGGLTSAELAQTVSSFRCKFQPDAALKLDLELNGDQIDSLSVDRKDDGYRIQLKLHVTGDPLTSVNYLVLAGGAPSLLTITPLQRELDAVDGSEMKLTLKNTTTGQQIELPVAKETVRQALAASRRKGDVIQVTSPKPTTH